MERVLQGNPLEVRLPNSLLQLALSGTVYQEIYEKLRSNDYSTIGANLLRRFLAESKSSSLRIARLRASVMKARRHTTTTRHPVAEIQPIDFKAGILKVLIAQFGIPEELQQLPANTGTVAHLPNLSPPSDRDEPFWREDFVVLYDFLRASGIITYVGGELDHICQSLVESFCFLCLDLNRILRMIQNGSRHSVQSDAVRVASLETNYRDGFFLP